MCEHHDHWAILLGIAYMLVEYFLGKSQKVKPNSVIELVLTLGAMFALKFLRGKKDGNQAKAD